MLLALVLTELGECGQSSVRITRSVLGAMVLQALSEDASRSTVRSCGVRAAEDCMDSAGTVSECPALLRTIKKHHLVSVRSVLGEQVEGEVVVRLSRRDMAP